MVRLMWPTKIEARHNICAYAKDTVSAAAIKIYRRRRHDYAAWVVMMASSVGLRAVAYPSRTRDLRREGYNEKAT